MNTYYDRYELKKILTDKLKKPKETIIRLNDYLKKHPYDYISYINLSELLLYVGEVEEADRVLEKVRHLCLNDRDYDSTTKRDWFEHIYKSVKLRIIIRQGDYRRVLDYYSKYEDRFNKKKLSYVKLYAEKQLGINKKLYDSDTYLFKQIKEYDYDRFLDHVIKHTSNNFEDEDEEVSSVFCPDFPLIEAVTEVKNKISTAPALFSRYVDDTYIFRYDDCGRVLYKLQDYFKVICLAGTKDIITMFPCNDCEKLPSVDLNYLKTGPKEEKKIKKLTAIEKFNKRYNINK